MWEGRVGSSTSSSGSLNTDQSIGDPTPTPEPTPAPTGNLFGKEVLIGETFAGGYDRDEYQASWSMLMMIASIIDKKLSLNTFRVMIPTLLLIIIL